MMIEPDVALTDYGLSVESGVFAWLMHRGSNPEQPVGSWFVLFFAASAVGSLAGGTVHGFYLDPTATGGRILWPVALIAVGAAALAAWGIGAHVQLSAEAARWVSRVAALWFGIYGGVIIFRTQTFAAAVLNYLPAAMFLLVAFVRAYRRSRDRVVLLGAGGMLLTFVAGGLQQAGIGLHPRYFTHNALYHLLQGMSLLLVFASARRLVRKPPC